VAQACEPSAPRATRRHSEPHIVAGLPEAARILVEAEPATFMRACAGSIRTSIRKGGGPSPGGADRAVERTSRCPGGIPPIAPLIVALITGACAHPPQIQRESLNEVTPARLRTQSMMLALTARRRRKAPPPRPKAAEAKVDLPPTYPPTGRRARRRDRHGH